MMRILQFLFCSALRSVLNNSLKYFNLIHYLLVFYKRLLVSCLKTSKEAYLLNPLIIKKIFPYYL